MRNLSLQQKQLQKDMQLQLRSLLHTRKQGFSHQFAESGSESN